MAEAAQFQRIERPRRWLRRMAALLAAAPILTGLLQLPAAPSVYAAEETTSSCTVDVSLDSLSPAAPSEGDTVTVSGTVTNKGKQTITNAHVGLRAGPELNSRSSVESAAKRTGFAVGVDATEIGGKYVEEFDKLTPGVSRSFSIGISVKELDLGSEGVYQLGVSLSGRTASVPYERVLGIQRTFLPWQPEDTDEKTRITYLWPLISTTHLTAETASDEEQTPLFEDDDLAKEIGPGGRLDQLVSLGSDLPVTWVIDPDLLATADAMTESYRVQGPNGTTVAGESQEVADRWLSRLEEAVQGQTVVTLPFADPDLASIAHRGKNVTGTLSHLKEATDVAAETVESVLYTDATTDFSWPVDGAVDSSIIDVATSAGANNVIARSDSLRNSLAYTPTAARPIGDGTTAVVSDTGLSTAFQDDMTRAETSTLAVQEFLAQTLMITQQVPAKARSIVVAPQRYPTASQAETMSTALHALDDRRWSQPLDLAAAAKTKPDPEANTRVPGSGSYPQALRKQELRTAAFEQLKETQEILDGFEVVLTDEDRVVTPFGNALRREMSNSWRGHSEEAAEFRDEVQNYLVSLTDKVQLIPKSDTTLSGRSATIPVTVQNNLVQGVDHLELRLTSTMPRRLELDNPQPVTVDGGHSQSVKFPASANANGQVEVIARLYTEDGVPYGDQMRFTVNVTEVTPTVMLVIAGGVLLLVLAGIRMYTQRKRASARQASENHEDRGMDTEENETEESEEDTPEVGDPEQQSDLAPDTAPESGGPSATGEKVDR